MECAIQKGIVQAIRNFPGRQELIVLVGQEQAKAINYPTLTGPCQPGDEVLLNTTAGLLQLGTGGWHYVLAVYGRERSLSKQGHIMKLRYTPLQGRVLSVEEQESPYHQIMAKAETLKGLPVAVGSLHSMLAPLAWIVKEHNPSIRLVYIMSDGAALPIALSRILTLLKKEGLVDQTITFGHAFGGDLEAINIYSALLAAKHVAQADLVVVTMGPGVVGTGTIWGTTAIEQGLFLNAVLQLQGFPIAIPRLSEGDLRARHQGLSHHSQTVLRKVVHSPVQLPLPVYFRRFSCAMEQVAQLKHNISWEETEEGFSKLQKVKLPLSTMGRGLMEDPLFFHGVVAAAQFSLKSCHV